MSHPTLDRLPSRGFHERMRATVVVLLVPPERADEVIPVGVGRTVRFVRRSDVRYAEAHGDYARLYTGAGSHLVRVPLAVLEEAWRDAGFVRIHRSHLVSLAHVDELVVESGRCTLRVGDVRLTVSRRNTGALRDRLVRGALPRRPHASSPTP
ncbi:LytTR family transcriptional regulator [Actinomadura bangladeshensis]|uniref:LytTR family transcriptional regulator n=2 Tax=Actinomadura bangladeshensis TaxID=453573 RepID=A0A6L9Q7A7_9ACTN|nr:LytTR family transcriptional regulator [Actinomadura bangladeshensis]